MPVLSSETHHSVQGVSVGRPPFAFFTLPVELAPAALSRHCIWFAKAEERLRKTSAPLTDGLDETAFWVVALALVSSSLKGRT
jgi:hypothetical protein